MTIKQNDLIRQIRTLRIMLASSEYGTIPPEAGTLVQSMTRELVDSLHTTAIYRDDSKGIWRTTVYIVEKGERKRKYISAKTEDCLYEKLYEYYVGPGTLGEVHTLWAHQRENEGLAAGTISREKQRWDKYIAGSDLEKTRVDEIDNFMIEDFIQGIIVRESVTPKELREILFLFRKTFHYAYRHKLIRANPIDAVEVNTSGCAPVPPKQSRSRIFLKEEVADIHAAIRQEILDKPYNTTALSIALLFVLGLRIGELVALRLSDIDWEEKTIHIHRMEQRGKKGYPQIVNHTKKKSPWGDRVLPLGDAGIAIIRQVLDINRRYGLQDEDFLFLGEKGERINIRAVDNRIRKLCRIAGIQPAKSAHDVRRTVATRLYRETHDIELVRKFMGHSDTQTAWGYVVDIEEEQEDRRRVVEALKGLSGFQMAYGEGDKIIVFRPASGSASNKDKKAGATLVQHFFKA